MKLLFPLTEVKLVGDDTKISLIRKGLIIEVCHFSCHLSFYHCLYTHYIVLMCT